MNQTLALPTGHADYGIDAPGVVRNLGLAGIGGIALAIAARNLPFTSEPFATVLLWNYGIWGGIGCLLSAAMMIWSSRVGKLKEREKILDMIEWHGDERVLDVGC